MTSEDRFAVRTHHHREFDLQDLVALKRRTGKRVSVVIPAQNEESTVGEVVAVVAHLADDVGLVDEVLVVDADSHDDTAERARAAGASVVRQSEVLPGSGTARGKGEALWKGLAASRGELVAFIDADLQEFDHRFLVGLLGPLLREGPVRFVKAAYDRPLRVGTDDVQPSGGGRVTELLARPLIATFWPELGWLAQPLSGEYAGERSLLESLPFVRGYGIELAMLIDILELHGVEVMAQVDLGRRVHRHQPLEALGRMSAEILHVALDRLARSSRVRFADGLEHELLQPMRSTEGELILRPHDVHPSERPPLVEWLGGH